MENKRPFTYFLHFFSQNFQVLCTKHRQHLKKLFQKINHMCATSDIWSRSNVSFIAVTVHFYCPKTLELQSRFIACSHFPGSHTANKISEKLNLIFEEYGILNKVAYITTDSASNYLASLKYHGDNYQSHRMEHTWLDVDDCDSENMREEYESEFEPYDDDDKIVCESNDLDEFTSNIVEEKDGPLLANMNHIKCGSHQLDKLGTQVSMH